ncbi:uncharacterized protein GJ701_016807 isoform 1-T1 [Geothlypis trichas]
MPEAEQITSFTGLRLLCFLWRTSTTFSRTSKYSLLNRLARLATTCGWDPFHSRDDCPHLYPPVNEVVGDSSCSSNSSCNDGSLHRYFCAISTEISCPINTCLHFGETEALNFMLGTAQTCSGPGPGEHQELLGWGLLRSATFPCAGEIDKRAPTHRRDFLNLSSLQSGK